nr:hypothetical protein Iba_chr02bCG19670 [Ipomoea batatas]
MYQIPLTSLYTESEFYQTRTSRKRWAFECQLANFLGRNTFLDLILKYKR